MKAVSVAAGCVGLAGVMCATPIVAADVPDLFIQQEAARADASLRQRAEAPMARAALLRSESPDETLNGTSIQALPQEAVSFPIEHITVISSEPVFKKYTHRLKAYTHNNIGAEGIAVLQKQLQEQILADGYMTSQVVVPNQDLQSGTLTFEIVPGYVEDIVLTNPKARTNWRSAFPVRPGHVLRRQALEQGIDQMRSVPGQDVKLSIEPGTKPLHSIVKVTVEQKGFVHGALIADNAGYESTGKYQGTVYLSFSQLAGLNDTLSAGYTKDIGHHGDGHGSKQYAVNYAVPDGNRTYRLSTYQYSYHQLIFMPEAFRSSGKTRGVEVSVEQVLNRTSRSKTAAVAKVIHKTRHSYIDDMEIGVQEQHTTALELGLSHRQYSGNTVSDVYLFYRQGIRGLGATVRGWEGLADNPTTLYKMAGLEGEIQSGVRIGHKQGVYTMRFRSQFTNQRLFGTDQFSIGGRYSVRGFSGEETLRGDSGYYIQNEWALPFRRQRITPYIGVDIGHVWGPSTATQIGHTLAGGVIGVRGTVGDAFRYDVSLGTPLKKPDGFTTDTKVWAFRGSYQF
ncbi:ShlB/FhaC/HecB family hemolysin secretion/activation protein [Veillonella rodentium]|uniref:Hemolysin transporter protein shlB n=1 Tax=Veillonella rodentium TaxID=248315 RepID=A0A239ZT36_9FIRM|nr:ShlB/FhaC/HecB family hemolysin secretion/activation protein [Veillonella rodentium]SNV73943.1 Hemolysin transporter protein shlB precursor [Veillonella rodentium]